MKVKILLILAIIFTTSSHVFAHDCIHEKIPQKTTYKEQKQRDKYLDDRLQLSEEQKSELRKNRAHFQKEMRKIVENMEDVHIEIRNVYYSGIPKFQADIKTAPMKAELVILKQNADKLRKEHRKTFESILTPEQKTEFQNFQKEIHSKK